MDNEKALVGMRKEITDLRAMVEELGSELKKRPARIGTSMRRQRQCPKCGHGSLLHINKIRDYSDTDVMTMSVQRKGHFFYSFIGEFEVYACRSCEFAEWYIRGAGDIDPRNLDKKNQEDVSIIEDEVPKEGVFR